MIITEEQMQHVKEILRANDNYVVDCGYDDENDNWVIDMSKIYVDGEITFDQMIEVVDYLRGNKND